MLRGADIGDQRVLRDHVEKGEALVAREAEHVLLERGEQRVAQQRIEQRRGPSHARTVRTPEPLRLQVLAARRRKPVQVVTRSVERRDRVALRERDARIAIHNRGLPRIGVVEECDLGEQRLLCTDLGREADCVEACDACRGEPREPGADRRRGGAAKPQALLDVSVGHGFARCELHRTREQSDDAHQPVERLVGGLRGMHGRFPERIPPRAMRADKRVQSAFDIVAVEAREDELLLRGPAWPRAGHHDAVGLATDAQRRIEAAPRHAIDREAMQCRGCRR